MAPTGKRCAGCGEIKTFINFYRSKKSSDGFKYTCKQCMRVSNRAWYEKRKAGHVTVTPKEKRCARCNITKKASEFHRQCVVTDGLQGSCKDCGRDRGTRNAQHVAALNAKWIMEQGGKCETCGEDRLDALQQVAIDPDKKKGTLHRPTTETNRLKELENIVVLCVCCQRIRSYQTRTHRLDETRASLSMTPHYVAVRKRSADTADYLRDKKRRIGKCSICDRSCDTQDRAILSSFDFDHLDRSTKMYNVSAMLSSARAKVDQELAKCRLLCANCHTIHTRDQFNHRQRTEALNSLQESTSDEEPDISPVHDDWTILFCAPFDAM